MKSLKKTMIKILTVFLIFLTVNNSFAQNAYPLRKGEQAPVDGVLLTPEEANRLKNIDQEHGYLTKENNLLNKLNLRLKDDVDIMEKRVDIYNKQNVDLSNRVQSLSGDNFWQNTIWFILGVGATIGVGYAASRTWR